MKLIKYAKYLIISVLISANCTFIINAQNLAPVKLKLQLQWKYQFQFAGYIAAIEKGFYKDEGLDVELIPANENEDTYKNVINGKAQFGVGSSDVIIMRSNGKELVILAPIFQHSPQVLLASKKSGIDNVHQLYGKKIAMEEHAADVITYMTNEGVEPNKCIVYPHSFNVDKLISGEVDAISSYLTDEPFILEERGFEYTVISPLSGGVDFYGDLIYTTETMIKTNPAIVEKFLKASIKGWKYALSNTGEIVDLIYNKYDARHSKAHLQYEADKLQRFILQNVVELGYSNEGRWNNIIDIYIKCGLIHDRFTSLGLFYKDYLDHGNTIPSAPILISIISLALISGITFAFYKLNKSLKNEIIKQKDTYEKYMQSDANYRLIAENMKDVVWIMDPYTLKFLYVSPSVEQLRGFTATEIMALPMDAALTPESSKYVRQLLASAANDFAKEPDKYYIEEVEQTCKDGGTVWTEVITKYYLNPKTNNMEIIGVTRDISKRKKVENELRKLSQATEQSPVSIVITNYKGEIEYVNSKFTEITGYTINEVMGENPRILKSGKMERSYYKMLWDTISAGNTWRGEFVNLKKNGELYYESAVITPIIDKHNNITHFLAVKENISERKLVEKSLMESEERYRTIINTSPDAICTTDLNGNILTASPITIKMWGYAGESEVIGRNVFEFVHPSNHDKAMYFINEMVCGNLTGVAEYLMLRKDGSTFYAEANANILKNSHDEPFGMMFVERDITERKLVEQALKESEERYRQLVETSQEGILVAVAGRFIYCNPMMSTLTGYANEELTMQNFIDFIFPEDIDLVINNYNRRVNEESVVPKYQFRIVRKDKVVRWVEISGIKLTWDDKPATLNFLSDITEQKQTQIELMKLNEDLSASKDEIEINLHQKNALIEELSETKDKLELTNATKDKFFSIIAHDLKNPLGNFRDVTRLLAESYYEFSEEDKIEFINLMKESSTNVYSLLENLLEWSRSQRGTINYNPSDCNLKLLTLDIEKLLIPAAEKKNITIDNQVTPFITVRADINMLNTVIRNLIFNAIKFTHESGRIIINAINNDNFVEVCIRDNGVGMSDALLEKLFRLDVNSSTIGTANETGTGLGLILCKEFVEKHDGRIWVESEVGIGTAFYFTLPTA